MKKVFFSFVIFSMLSLTSNFAQSQKDKVEAVATHFLNAMANQSMVASEFIAPQSLDKFKDSFLSMAFSFDSTGTSNSMMLLPANAMKSMTSAEVWDYMGKIANTMQKHEKSAKMEIVWKILESKISNTNSTVTYQVEGRDSKIMNLINDHGKWKVVLSNNSIF